MSARYEILINGKRHCICGLHGEGVLAINMTHVDTEQNKQPHSIMPGALGHFDDSIQESHHAQWPAHELQEGDEITIRILTPGDFDPPTEVFPT